MYYELVVQMSILCPFQKILQGCCVREKLPPVRLVSQVRSHLYPLLRYSFGSELFNWPCIHLSRFMLVQFPTQIRRRTRIRCGFGDFLARYSVSFPEFGVPPCKKSPSGATFGHFSTSQTLGKLWQVAWFTIWDPKSTKIGGIFWVSNHDGRIQETMNPIFRYSVFCHFRNTVVGSTHRFGNPRRNLWMLGLRPADWASCVSQQHREARTTARFIHCQPVPMSTVIPWCFWDTSSILGFSQSERWKKCYPGMNETLEHSSDLRARSPKVG